jgi:anti-anti-sigma factor
LATSAQHSPLPAGQHRRRQSGPTGFGLVENAVGGRVALVQVVGELDASVVEQLIAAIARVPRGQETIVVALDECEFIDSSGIAALLRARLELEATSRRLLLCAPRGQVRRVLEITGVSSPAFVVESLDDVPG